MKLARVRRDRFILARPVARTVTVSSWSLIAITAIDVVMVFVSATSFAQDGSLPMGMIVFGATLSLVFAAFFAALAVLLRRGVNWARVILTVFAAIQLVSLIAPPSAEASEGIQQARIVIESLITIAATVLLWLPSSNAFFRTVRNDRRLHRSRQFRP